MSTIYPPANGVSYNREEAGANTHVSFNREAPLTNEQLAAMRAESARLRRPLSDAEREAILGLKPEQRPSARVVVI